MDNAKVVVVTRHYALVQYLSEVGLVDLNTDVQVIDHASAEDVTGKHVIGVLPNYLACECMRLTEVPLNIPLELRGKELSLEQLRQYAGQPVTYVIRKIDR